MNLCRSCRSEELEDLGACAPFAGRDDNDKIAGRLYRCLGCDFRFRAPIPALEELVEMYRTEPVDRLDYLFDKNVAWTVALKYLEQNFKSRSQIKILDVGCHTGNFLARLPKKFCRFGVEADGGPANVARSKNRIELIGERIESISPQYCGQFDAITMFDVLEHLPNPRIGLESAAQLLAPGGVLILSTGDADSWTWRVLGAGHWYLQAPQHLSVLSSRYLSSLAQEKAWQLPLLIRIAHHKASLLQRMKEAIELIHWGSVSRHKLPWKITRRALQELPGFRKLRHRESVPWTLTLKDHLVAAIKVR